ncbi:MAG: helix-turn-helix domain-containing protein, partial [Bacteroidales bacterium]|nr:helix-turn-helix domain-containing protein [Bacteroidales bacterium]
GTREEPFSEVDMVIIAPFVPHVWKAREEGNRVITVQFSGKMLDFPMLRLRQFRSIETFLKRAVPAAKFHLSEDDPLVSETLALARAKDFDATVAFLRLLNSMAEREFTILGDVDSGMRQSRSRRVAKVMEYSQEHLGETIRLSDVSSLVDMSDSAFSHFFKKHTNLSYITYLNGLRISRACRELESTAMSVSEICWDCGFNNKSNFNRLFLQAKGMTPSAYRKYISRILV